MFGLGGLNPKKMQQMMSQMGIKSEEIDSDEVIIKGKDKNIIIKNPSVTKMNISGQEMFQISGISKEEARETITEEDIETVASQTKVSKEKAREALKEAGGDLATAIMELKK